MPDSSELIVDQLNQVLLTFGDQPKPLTVSQQREIQKFIDFLNKDLTKLGTSARYAQLRARPLLRDIYKQLGPEVFILCALGSSITQIGKLPDDTKLLGRLSEWWGLSAHPSGLQQISSLIRKDHELDALVYGSHDAKGDTGSSLSHPGSGPEHQASEQVLSRGTIPPSLSMASR